MVLSRNQKGGVRSMTKAQVIELAIAILYTLLAFFGH